MYEASDTNRSLKNYLVSSILDLASNHVYCHHSCAKISNTVALATSFDFK